MNTEPRSRSSIVAPLLMVTAIPFMRPFVFGEKYTPVGIALLTIAAVLAIYEDHQSQQMERALRNLLFWIGLLWGWSAILAILHPATNVGIFVKGVAGGPLVIIGACLVLRDARRRKIVLKGTMWLVVAVCVSFLVTFALWLTLGFGTGQIATLPGGYRTAAGAPSANIPLFFPFTPVTGSYGDGVVPRLLGLGREPGMMAPLVGWALLTALRERWNRSLIGVLIAGLAGTQSTAGFGVVLAVWVATSVISIPVRHQQTLFGIARQMMGIALLAGAVWLAIAAPTYGVQAKAQLNPASVSDRRTGTLNGLAAITEHPLGQDQNDPDAPIASGGINLIAAISQTGVLGLVFSLGSLLGPWWASKQRRGAAGGVLVVVGTVLTAQPLAGSTGLYMLIALAVGTMSASGRAEVGEDPGSEHRVGEEVGPDLSGVR